MICFEFPLVERVRIFLRLEILFNRFDFLISQSDTVPHHYALHCLFEIMECSFRADLKLDIIREIERQKQHFSMMRRNEEVDQDKLTQLLESLEDIFSQLQKSHQKFGARLKENEWLMLLKQKMSIPGGASPFDFPSYYSWLESPTQKRITDLNCWFAPLALAGKAIRELMIILRESPIATHELVAKSGQYQQSSLGEHAHLVRVHLAKSFLAIPEVSANKYVTNIRFIGASTDVNKGAQISQDIPFQLEVCKF